MFAFSTLQKSWLLSLFKRIVATFKHNGADFSLHLSPTQEPEIRRRQSEKMHKSE
jgi:hypothetical protein